MPTSRHSTYRNLPARWADDTIIELTARGASTGEISDILAVADSHCADSGEDVTAAFGTPFAYAAAVHLPGADRQAGPHLASAASAVLGLTAMGLGVRLGDAWRAGTAVEVRLGDLVSILLLAAAATLIVRHLGWLVHRRWLAIAVAGLAVSGSVALTVLDTPVLATIPTVLAALLCLGALAASGLSAMAAPRTEPIAHPAVGDPHPRSTRLVEAASAWLFAPLTLLVVLMSRFV